MITACKKFALHLALIAASAGIARADVKTDLLNAVKAGNQGEVARLSSAGVDSRVLNEVLQWAAALGFVEIVKTLVANGADPDWKAPAYGGSTALYVAAQNGSVPVVELFLERRADVNARTNDGSTPLHAAMEDFVDAQKKPKAPRGDNVNAMLRIVDLLLSKGANVNARKNDGAGPLEYAVMSEQKELVERLVARGAELNQRLRGHRDGATPLHMTIWRDRTEMALLLIERGANVNLMAGGGTPLGWAAHRGNSRVVEALVKRGAPIEVRDEGGRTALVGALETAVLSDPSAGGKSFQDYALSRLSAAARKKVLDDLRSMELKEWLRVAKFLVASGADVNTGGARANETPLGLAAILGDTELVSDLIAKGANLEAGADYGATPLHFAISSLHSAAARILVSRGANVNAIMAPGRFTPLHLVARFLDDAELADLLISRGATVSAMDEEGRTPLRWAERMNHGRVANLLRSKAGTGS